MSRESLSPHAPVMQFVFHHVLSLWLVVLETQVNITAAETDTTAVAVHTLDVSNTWVLACSGAVKGGQWRVAVAYAYYATCW